MPYCIDNHNPIGFTNGLKDAYMGEGYTAIIEEHVSNSLVLFKHQLKPNGLLQYKQQWNIFFSEDLVSLKLDEDNERIILLTNDLGLQVLSLTDGSKIGATYITGVEGLDLNPVGTQRIGTQGEFIQIALGESVVTLQMYDDGSINPQGWKYKLFEHCQFSMAKDSFLLGTCGKKFVVWQIDSTRRTTFYTDFAIPNNINLKPSFLEYFSSEKIIFTGF